MRRLVAAAAGGESSFLKINSASFVGARRAFTACTPTRRAQLAVATADTASLCVHC